MTASASLRRARVSHASGIPVPNAFRKRKFSGTTGRTARSRRRRWLPRAAFSNPRSRGRRCEPRAERASRNCPPDRSCWGECGRVWSSRRRCACAGAAVFLRCRISGTVGTDKRPLRIGYLPITDAAPLLLAHAKILLDATGFTPPNPRVFVPGTRSWRRLLPGKWT